MARYLTVTWASGYDEARVKAVEARTQSEAASQAFDQRSNATEVEVYTLATGSPISRFQRRTVTETVIKKIDGGAA